ncbi:hypothetical protein NBRC116602_07080 [Hyphomicrobiales bacterium 4NK60-0047b]
MPVKTFAQFKSDCKKLTDDENALGNAVANQIKEYVDNSPHPRGKKDEAYERFFENIYKKTGQKPPAAIPESITGNQTPSKYRDEIKQGRGDQTFVIAIFYWFSEICEEKAYSEAIRKALTEVTPPEQSPPQPYLEPPFDGNLTEDDWLNPRYEDGIPFQGREYEKSLLTAFAKNPDIFKIWAVSGPSGAGKTRLVSHWLREFIKAEGQDRWNIGFFTRDAKDDFGVEEFKNWIPDKPTFIIIDYIYNFNDIIKALFDKCYREQTYLQHPIRLLLIDHVFPQSLDDITNDHYLGDLTTGSTDLFEKKKVFFDNSPMQLEKEQQNADDLKEIVAYAANMWNINPTPVDDKLIDEAISFLEKTKGAFCPLFAALKGYAIGRNYDTPFGDRRGLIKYYLESTERLPWDNKDKSKAKIGKWVGSFVSVATILRDISFEHLAQFLPDDLYDNHDDIIARCKTITSSNDIVILPPFEPDILGESFFLLWFESVIADHKCKSGFIDILCNPINQNEEQKHAENFLGFIERLTRNLSNDMINWEQSSGIDKSLSLIVNFLNSDSYPENKAISWTVSIALVDIVKQLKEKNLEQFASKLFKQIHTNDFERASDSFLNLKTVIAFIEYFEIAYEKGKTNKNLENTLLKILKNFELKNDSKSTVLMMIASNFRIKTNAIRHLEKINHSIINHNVNRKNSFGWTATMYACHYGNKDIVELLIREREDINILSETGWNALMSACYQGDPEIIDLLLRNGADPNISTFNNGRTALMLVCHKEDTKIADLLLRNGANANMTRTDTGWTALMYACQHGYTKMVDLLMSHQADANIITIDNGTTALMAACHQGYTEIASLLLSNGANPNIATDTGWTALMCACQHGYTKMVDLLMSHQADVNKTTIDNGTTALMTACYQDYTEIASLLLSNGADPNIATINTGYTSLMMACLNSQQKIVQLLLDHGADINAKDKEGDDILYYAEEGGDTAIINLIENERLKKL